MNSEASLCPMTEQSVLDLLRRHGAETASRSGRSEHYGAPRDFTFEVRGSFSNGMGLQIVARQFNYRDPWEAEGRVNDLVDVSLLSGGAYSPLPKGYPFFQGHDQEEGVDWIVLEQIVVLVAGINRKIYELQKLTGLG